MEALLGLLGDWWTFGRNDEGSNDGFINGCRSGVVVIFSLRMAANPWSKRAKMHVLLIV